ncbi:hypothetical protein EAY27_13935 [Vibrio anguillarum]|uniref:hypothetical protein n=1 Tax=Vibrio anguillarum TaxID=55601 RepID=UPI00188D5877|nr:hypothetical protein [Vibrio anguillarum]MBF4256893.1 hypothetical protein [Vibrio anguillarum]MBF4278276.1 hypothetical protein [Vibrio anguillarum]MBF4298739.1 hypothetical protein [Vibrio anguillarum]MBF4359614.1 hypothetical protein [Vibrio anguillarum]MBF4362714.1 hypothetical protein [Vibrio anguillarum]
MSSLFESARGLLRASIADCFGHSILVTTAEGDQLEIIGYIQSAKRGEHTVHRLLTDEALPEQCSTVYKDKPYMLVYEMPVKSTGTDSQITREYVMVQKGSGARGDGWSEYQ